MEQDEFLTRIIPTRVGTSTDNYVKAANLKDHPHACRDKSLALVI